ncbi:MAG: alpha/beta fold hydrolase [Balneolaceae bacterium]|nr:alpha/beta fold hydrolase [Balneolaceae bacterium]
MQFKDASGEIRTVTNIADWEQKRWQILEGMEDVMGKLPDRSSLPALDLQITDTLKTDRYNRLTIRFTAAEGEVVPAYLYIPFRKGVTGKLPAMLVLHGTGDGGKRLVDGESPLPNRAHAKELAERGYIVIAPDYPSMGDLIDHDFQNDRYESGTMKGIFNHMRSVDLLLSREDVDPERIGVLGHSLGGHNAMFAAAFDTRLKVIVSSCGWTQMDYYDIGEVAEERFGGRLGPWAQDRYMPLIREKYNLDGDFLPFDFHEVIAVLAPRPFFSNSPLNDSNFDVEGVRLGVSLASEAYRFLGAEENLQVRYPEAEHDFPVQTRKEAYRFIDQTFNHVPSNHVIE